MPLASFYLLITQWHSKNTPLFLDTVYKTRSSSSLSTIWAVTSSAFLFSQFDLAPNVWLHSSVGRASHRYSGGRGLESRWSPDFLRLLLSNCLHWKITCDDHSSLSKTNAVSLRLQSGLTAGTTGTYSCFEKGCLKKAYKWTRQCRKLLWVTMVLHLINWGQRYFGVREGSSTNKCILDSLFFQLNTVSLNEVAPNDYYP